MKNSQSSLRLIDDPVARTVWMLKSMPLESVVAYLELVAAQANRLGLLADQDKLRIATLLAQVPVAHLEKVA